MTAATTAPGPGTSTAPYVVRLSARDVTAVDALLDELTRRHDSVERDEVLDSAAVWAAELPRGLRAGLREFRLAEPAGVCLVRGYPLDQAAIGPTPRHWRDLPDVRSTRREELFLLLCASLLGEPFGWASTQRARVVQDVLPIAGDENAQLGSSSETELTWHVEDGFHPYRPDHVGLMCLRNPDAVPTTYAGVRDLPLHELPVRVLREPRFVIRPDESHVLDPDDPDLRDRAPRSLLERSRDRLARLHAAPTPVPVLFGDPDEPYLLINSYYMRAVPGDEEAAAALARVVDLLGRRMVGVPLAPGDVCFLDNYQVVHGRAAFTARFDGSDRWLKRVNVTSDLRKSRDSRTSARSRIVY
ncbi:guanitoxin biosynthesis L-enduracididine beta-hydroxylase GntD [Micromonospora sp. RP3T]|uniref:guanitoxin biosynthesis L-enduracididine beta-hydroxylase GntD n=1 Tax=Micromonospora sp. RP3T TaxID=2135446 RepID=UPI000D16314B|nr:guanitoxin biosynthesis L-enduracididine beta-hydroxylase GntD [Micromonospora sp. RP3T]PTA46525.1 arginine beta-hydroxylase, Fe(II)/alpha-ketoglutarate-dependent [Micromonospora sp. RP3T]